MHFFCKDLNRFLKFNPLVAFKTHSSEIGVSNMFYVTEQAERLVPIAVDFINTAKTPHS